MVQKNAHINSNEDDKSTDKKVYAISIAAKMVGTTEHTLRVYEREGLIVLKKKPSGHRLYTDKDIERLKSIREMIILQKLSIAGIKALYALIPCWKLINCSENDRKNCDAFQCDFYPCWTYKHKNNVCGEYDCRDCSIYKKLGNYNEVRKLIKIVTSD